MSHPSLSCTSLSFAWPDDTPVFSGLTLAIGPGRTGLVAPNGAGKSTLLRLLVGDLKPTAGSVAVDGELGYLPQTLALTLDDTVDEVLGIAPVRAAIAAIESGDASEENFAVVGTDWDVEERARAVLDRLGLADVGLDRPLRTLSGGQIISLGLAAQLVKQPDVLVLDEPTNNLDLEARERLYAVVESWKGCLLVVSHDRALLDRMDQIVELVGDEVRFFGGNFTEYTEAVEREQDAAERAVRSAEQEVKRQKREAQEAKERAAKRASNAKKNLANAGLPKIIAGQMQRYAQESAGKANDMHAQRLEDARTKLEQANQDIRQKSKIAISLPDTEVPAGRTVLVAEGINAVYGAGPVFAEPVDLAIRGPERIALIGGNGSGKSTLLRMLDDQLEPSTGTVRRASGRTAFLSQRLDTLDQGRTIWENLKAAAPERPETELRHRLAQFLFRGDTVHRPVGALSGGERLRATLVCVLSADPAPQLLLLDEPTNNLDLVSAGQLENALDAYQGAFVVVSHDLEFLRAIRVNRWLRVHDGELTETSAPGS
ncbi:ATP-binding cassette domain-containing protein [Allokutzneria sp. A3M-2-11 16]|uniref:ABC-F family ATP-binding cassette domain-containing protein n=1 Tax=Allokutzneria sp. A3M-2-11 16 TaxID=2962043 RepID=UPI0020B8A0E8|nr:ABC-F family ATP-binding cassette domain-containing protein [Allokutzneria sp. A3M-2-11 16]MCP3802697.1 ATP-binding cassette domain-containing protein [Allokutzneria sp. A3M-2-11 16]